MTSLQKRLVSEVQYKTVCLKCKCSTEPILNQAHSERESERQETKFFIYTLTQMWFQESLDITEPSNTK